jgi:cell division transport system permease protein
MATWLIYHRRALRHALQRLFATPLSALLSVLVIGLTLSLPAGLYHLLQSGARAIGQQPIDPEISLFAKLDASAEQIAKIKDELSRIEGIAQTRFVPKEEAFERMKRAMDTADLLEGIERNPLPDAFIIKADSKDPAKLAQLRDRLAQLPGIEHARIDLQWARTLAASLRLAQRVTLIVALGLCAGLVLVVGNTIRLQLLDAKDEIELSRLIGAAPRYVRRPYLYFGALQGLLGGALAATLVWIALKYFNQSAADLLNLSQINVALPNLTSRDTLRLVVLATVLGWLGAYVSVQAHLTQRP